MDILFIADLLFDSDLRRVLLPLISFTQITALLYVMWFILNVDFVGSDYL